MAETTQSESAVMATTAAKFDQVNDSLQSMLSTLMSELSMLSGSWKGMGAAAFEQVKQQYSSDLKKLNQALSETSMSISESGKSYDATDSAAASRVSGTTGGGISLPL